MSAQMGSYERGQPQEAAKHKILASYPQERSDFLAKSQPSGSELRQFFFFEKLDSLWTENLTDLDEWFPWHALLRCQVTRSM